MCKVLNKRFDDLAGAIYIGRPSKWGNPFTHKADGTLADFVVIDRATAVAKYEEYLMGNVELLKALPELTGKNLVCWCAPSSCHGDVLIKYANNERFLALVRQM